MDRRIRRVVHARQRQIKLLEEYRQALIHQAVTGQIDVRTGKPYPAYKDSGVEWLGQVPEHWEVRRGKTLFKRVQRPVRPEDDVVTCFRDGIVTLRRNRRTEGFTESLKEIGYQGIRRGDLVIHAMDAFAGAVGVADCDGKGSPVYTVCIPSREANQYYFAHVLREMARSGWILALATGIRERSTDFRFGTCGSQILPLPPLPEQTAIVEYLDAQTAKIDAAIAAARREIELLREYRERLIADVVTGKVDVREVAARLPEEPPEEDSEWMGTEEMADEDTADEESGAEVLSEEGDL
jgi:type I restriction enzyme S subunit